LHAQSCSLSGATIYAAGVLITENGYVADTQKLRLYAAELDMLVAMANHTKPNKIKLGTLK